MCTNIMEIGHTAGRHDPLPPSSDFFVSRTQVFNFAFQYDFSYTFFSFIHVNGFQNTSQRFLFLFYIQAQIILVFDSEINQYIPYTQLGSFTTFQRIFRIEIFTSFRVAKHHLTEAAFSRNISINPSTWTSRRPGRALTAANTGLLPCRKQFWKGMLCNASRPVLFSPISSTFFFYFLPNRFVGVDPRLVPAALVQQPQVQ